MNYDVTICVLSHNNKEITQKFIELLYSNTDRFHLIMIDNGSTDGTVDYLNDTLSMFGNSNRKNEQITFVANKENLGVIGGRNMGFALYQERPTDYLCFLDNDQFVQKGWLEQHIKYLHDNCFNMVGADAWLMDRKFMPKYHCSKSGDPYSYVGCGGMLLKKEVVDAVGFFDEQFNPAYFEDPDYNFRAMQKGYRVGYNHSAKITHLPHQTLGKNANKMLIFRESYAKFCVKWKDYQPIVMR